MKAMVMGFTLAMVASYNAEAALSCKNKDLKQQLVIGYDHDQKKETIELLSEGQASVQFEVLDKKTKYTRVGAIVHYVLQDPDANEAHLSLSEKEVFVPGECTRASCDGGFKMQTSAVLTYLENSQSMSCHEKFSF